MNIKKTVCVRQPIDIVFHRIHSSSSGVISLEGYHSVLLYLCLRVEKQLSVSIESVNIRIEKMSRVCALRQIS